MAKKPEEKTNAEPMTHTHVRLPPRGVYREPEVTTEEIPEPSAPTTDKPKK